VVREAIARDRHQTVPHTTVDLSLFVYLIFLLYESYVIFPKYLYSIMPSYAVHLFMLYHPFLECMSIPTSGSLCPKSICIPVETWGKISVMVVQLAERGSEARTCHSLSHILL
jgi:hypothetical protein